MGTLAVPISFSANADSSAAFCHRSQRHLVSNRPRRRTAADGASRGRCCPARAALQGRAEVFELGASDGCQRDLLGPLRAFSIDEHGLSLHLEFLRSVAGRVVHRQDANRVSRPCSWQAPTDRPPPSTTQTTTVTGPEEGRAYDRNPSAFSVLPRRERRGQWHQHPNPNKGCRPRVAVGHQNDGRRKQPQRELVRVAPSAQMDNAGVPAKDVKT